MSENRTGKRIEASGRTLELLRTVAAIGPASATEIATELGFAKSTAYYHLETLADFEFVVRRHDGYQLSMNFLSMGHDLVNQLDIYQVGKPQIDRLAEETGELCILMTEEHGYGYYIYDNRGEGAVNFDTIGHRKHLHNNALGKAVLAHMDERRVDEILDRHGLPPTTDRTITDRAALKEELATARSEGVAFDREEQLNGLCCIAAPLLDSDSGDDREVKGAISVAVPASRARGTYFNEELPMAVSDTANLVELELQDY
ncbi:transcriptional regulator, IclR family [Halogranum gelatinilyticum]|uniref:Transcriptional regulator, IclR family n=1 Tax=Halogranum gelatinilyticum TaxID=660521 RepID=A0A1G9ZTJ6_9EURY|nr:IclR family transcriptional regulator [Halogranum gelatinilyticum]SDN24588.1 transcriptional regulator, IclR family [Halogranum gelatinilyticum]